MFILNNVGSDPVSITATCHTRATHTHTCIKHAWNIHAMFSHSIKPWISCYWHQNAIVKKKKMQLDIEVSPPANKITLALTFTHMTFGLDLCNLWLMKHFTLATLPVTLKWVHKARNKVFWSGDLDLWPMTLNSRVHLGVIHVCALTKFCCAICYISWNMTYCLVTFLSSLNFGPVTDIHTYIHHSAYAQLGSKM